MEKLMIEKSDQLLHAFFGKLEKKDQKHVGLMGGWAVHYLLKGRDVVHMGSRDIDIFFDPQNTSPKSVERMLEKMGFHKHSTFRWVKIFHSETEKELHPEESKSHPLHNLSYVYFDVATPAKIAHTLPEPLLKKVFGKEKAFVKVKGLKIMVPSAKILVEMKIKSAPERDSPFKRTKDIADLYALLASHRELWETKNGTRIKPKGLNRRNVKIFRQKLKRFKIDGTIADASTLANINQSQIQDVLDKI